MHLIASLMLPAAEYVYIVASSVRIHNTQETCLVGLCLRFAEISLRIGNPSAIILRIQIPHLGHRRLWISTQQFERMIAFHHRIGRHTVHTYSIMTGKLTVILQIVQSRIKRLADSGIRPQRQPLSIKLHRKPVGMLMISFACIKGIHQASLRIHSVALHQPAHLRHIKCRAYIILDVSGNNCGVNHQSLLRVEVHQITVCLTAGLSGRIIRFKTA